MRFLIDENLEEEVRRRLSDAGHDVVHGETSDALERGIDDARLAAVSREDRRVIVTYDDDFRDELTDEDYHGVLLIADQSIPPDRVAEILDRVASYHTTEQLDEIRTVGRSWL